MWIFFKLLKPAYNSYTNYVHLQVILSHLLIITAGWVVWGFFGVCGLFVFFLKKTPFFRGLVFVNLLLNIRVVSTWCRDVSHGLHFLLVQVLLLLVTTQMTLSTSKRGTERQTKC